MTPHEQALEAAGAWPLPDVEAVIRAYLEARDEQQYSGYTLHAPMDLLWVCSDGCGKTHKPDADSIAHLLLTDFGGADE